MRETILVGGDVNLVRSRDEKRLKRAAATVCWLEEHQRELEAWL